MKMNDQQKMLLNNIMQHQFATLDSALFLDTHPNDPMALYRHNVYSAQYNQLKANYERAYGPLTDYGQDMSGNWRYIDAPWPWEC